mgnify:FL=1
MAKGDSRPIRKVQVVDKKTKPPAAYTEATLLRDMETAGKFVADEDHRLALKDSGLGTPATRAETIEKLIRVGYMVRDKKRLVPTPKGKQLIEIIDSRLKSPELTGSWERRLNLMSRGKHPEEEFQKDIRNLVTEIILVIKTARIDATQRDNLMAGEPPGPYPRKASPIAPALNQKPSRATTSPRPEPRIPPPQPKTKEGIPMEVFGACPKCGVGGVIKGKTAFGCNRYRDNCHFRLPLEFHGKTLNEKMVRKILIDKETGTLKGFVLDTGETVSGKICLDPGNHCLTLTSSRKREKKSPNP